MKFIGTTRTTITSTIGPTTSLLTNQQTSTGTGISSSSTLTTTTVSLIINTIGQQVGSNDATSTESSRNLAYLALLIIPLILILILMFMCCCGRSCLSCLFNSCSISLCGCFRPDGSSTSKAYDAVVVYNDYDEAWVEERFLPFFEDMCGYGGQKRSRVAKLTRLGGESTANLNQTDIDTLRSSKRFNIYDMFQLFIFIQFAFIKG